MSSVKPRRQHSTSGPRQQRDDSRDQRQSSGPRKQRDDEQRRPAGPRRSDDEQRPKSHYIEARDPVFAPKPRKQEFVTVNTGYGTQEPIEKSKFLEGLNTLKLSSNVINLCNQVDVTENRLTDMAHDSFNNTYYYLFNSKILDYTTTWEAGILKAYDIHPCVKMSEELVNDIATMKWNIYCAYKANNITDTIVKFIGVVAGVSSYFEQLDTINVTTKYYSKIKSDHTYNDIKLL